VVAAFILKKCRNFAATVANAILGVSSTAAGGNLIPTFANARVAASSGQSAATLMRTFHERRHRRPPAEAVAVPMPGLVYQRAAYLDRLQPAFVLPRVWDQPAHVSPDRSPTQARRQTADGFVTHLPWWWLFQGHPCFDPDGPPDHDWKFISDWYGDPGVINGTADCSFMECQRCGEQRDLTDSDYVDAYDEDEWR
jgi:hypothetical protein